MLIKNKKDHENFGLKKSIHIPCLKDDRVLTIQQEKQEIRIIFGDLINFSISDPRNLCSIREMINKALQYTGLEGRNNG